MMTEGAGTKYNHNALTNALAVAHTTKLARLPSVASCAPVEPPDAEDDCAACFLNDTAPVPH